MARAVKIFVRNPELKIATAGGFTYRAKKDYVYVIRADDPQQKEIKLSVEEKIQPGDIIRIAERLF